MEFIRQRKEGWLKILKIAWPLILANSFWNLQLTIDRILLGQFSTDALGAAMAVGGVFWTPMALLQQTAAYSMTFVAQYFGAKQFKMIGPAVWQALYLSFLGGFLFLFFIPITPPFFSLIGHSPNVQPLEVEYFISLCFSALPAAVVAAISGFYSGLGKSQTVMWINAVGLVVNAVLDYVMIFGRWGCPAYGIAGAGYATAIANAASATAAFYFIYRDDADDTFGFRSGWRLNIALMKRFLRYGVPSGMQWALEGMAFTVFLIFIGHMVNGDAGLAASGIVVTVMLLAILPAMGVAQAVSILVGQHLGEKNPEQAAKDTWSGLQVAVVYIFAMGLSFAIFPEFYLMWFKNETNLPLWTEVSIIVPYLLLCVALFTSFDSMNLVFSFALKGAGDTRFVTMVALVMPWPLMVLPTWYFSNRPNAVYLAWEAASLYIILQACVFWRRFTGGKWKSMSVIN